MLDSVKLIENNFLADIELKKFSLQILPDKIALGASVMVDAIHNGGKILVCGNGGSASDAQHFVAELVNRFMLERRPLPAISLNSDTATITAIANDYGYENVFIKQVQALGQESDVLLVISTSGNSPSVIKATEEAIAKGMSVVALTGNKGGLLSNILRTSKNKDCDKKAEYVEIRVMDNVTPRIQETHILIIHCLCEIIEKELVALA